MNKYKLKKLIKIGLEWYYLKYDNAKDNLEADWNRKHTEFELWVSYKEMLCERGVSLPKIHKAAQND